MNGCLPLGADRSISTQLGKIEMCLVLLEWFGAMSKCKIDSCISYLWLHNQSPYNLVKNFGLKQQTFIISEQLWVRNSGATQLNGCGSGTLVRLQSRCWLGPQSSEGSTGAARSASKMAYLHGCWQEASVLRHMAHSMGQLECPHDMAAGFPQIAMRKPQCLLYPNRGCQGQSFLSHSVHQK